MNNSIYYYGFNRLLSLTKCPKEALLLDKIIFHHQGTLLKRDDRLWFTKKIPELASELGFSESRIYIYLKNLEEEGFIIRKRFKYYGVPRSFISISERLQKLLLISPEQPTNTLEVKEKGPISENILNERMDSLVSRDTNNKEKYRVVNNITHNKLNHKLSHSELNTVKGMIYNIQKKHNVRLSSPQKVLDEVIFSLSNKAQFENIETFQHKINIISQLLRDKRWKTPKGFNKYSPEAKRYQEEYEQKQTKRIQIKKEELNYSGFGQVVTSNRLQNVYESNYRPCPKLAMQKSLQVQQSLVNGIRKNIDSINNPTILKNFFMILKQEKLKLAIIESELSQL